MIKDIKKNPKVLFFVENARLFRTTLIGNLYEIAQVCPTVLLLGRYTPEMSKILDDKRLFPKLEKTIFFETAFGDKIFTKNKTLYKLQKDIIKDYKPDVIIVHNDISPASLYLLRFGKKTGALNVVLQAGFKVGGAEETAKYFYLSSAYLKWPSFVPLSIRLFLVTMKKYLGHFFYFWILPLTVGEFPFPGKSSSILMKGKSGMRDSDYSVVFSKREKDICVQDGVPKEKLFILDHPLLRESSRKIFEETFFSNKIQKVRDDPKALTLMFPAEVIGFKKGNYSFISIKENQRKRLAIIGLIVEVLKDWKIYIKPHPAVTTLPAKIKKEVDQNFETIKTLSNNIIMVDPFDPVDKYIEMSKVIVGIPPASFSLYTAPLQNPGKTTLSLDFEQEILGDIYKGECFSEIEYIDNKNEFISILELIRDNKYYRESKTGSKVEDFSNTVDLLNCLLEKKYNLDKYE